MLHSTEYSTDAVSQTFLFKENPRFKERMETTETILRFENDIQTLNLAQEIFPKSTRLQVCKMSLFSSVCQICEDAA